MSTYFNINFYFYFYFNMIDLCNFLKNVHDLIIGNFNQGVEPGLLVEIESVVLISFEGISVTVLLDGVISGSLFSEGFTTAPYVFPAFVGYYPGGIAEFA